MTRAQWSWSSRALRRGAVAAVGLALLAAAGAVAVTDAFAGPSPVETARAPEAPPKPAAVAAQAPAAPERPLDPITVRPDPHPLDGATAAEIDALLRKTPERLGPASVGRPNGGRLLNGVPLVSGAGLEVVDPSHAYGTEATVRSLRAAVDEVLAAFPDSRPLFVGDLSRNGGGYLRPHRSHQSGLDADVGYYHSRERHRWYLKATAENLDRPRTWALLKAIVGGGNVEYVFMDRSVQALLREHAASAGEPPELLDALFGSARSRGFARTALVRHARRHLTHFHVRFVDPVAEETGRRVFPGLRRLGRI